MATFFTVLLTAFFTAIFTAIFTYKKARHILIEKWMNRLRDEVSKYLGLCEKLRLLLLVGQANLSDTIYSNLVTSMYKIELLLDRKEDKDSNNQKKLLEKVTALQRLAQSKRFTEYEDLEREVVDYTYKILGYHWTEINSELKNYPIHMIKRWLCKFSERLCNNKRNLS
jgi:hypothetical protein